VRLNTFPRVLMLIILCFWLAVPALAQDLFETRIRPIFATECLGCHADSELGGLRLDSRDRILRGGKSGPAIVPGDPDNSLMIKAVRQTGELKMPMGGRLRPDQVEALVEWVRAGAEWPVVDKAALEKNAKNVTVKADVISPERRAFWSFGPLKPSPPPAVKDKLWPKTNIDRFILAD